MKKEDIIKIIAGEFNVSEIEVMNYFDDIFDTLIECFRKNKNVNISEFGKFFLRIRLNAEGVKEKTVKFSPVKKLADDVNYNFNNLTKVRLRTLEERALDDIVKLQEADINLPEDLVMSETIEEPEEIIIKKETPSEEHVEPVSDKKEGIHVEEIETYSSDIKESIEDIHLEKKTEDEKEDKDFDVDTEMRSFLLEHIGYTKRKEEKLEEDKQAAEIIEEEKLEEKDKALSKDKFKEELEKITAEREKLIAEIDELHPEKKETEKEEEQSAPQEMDIILEKEEPLPTEKTELEREEEQLISTELDKILKEEEPLPTEKIEPEKEEEKTKPEEEREQPVPKELIG
jgi:nucleoid DNA-binding protein